MSRASAKSIRSGVTSPPNSADNLKTGYLVSAFKDSDDMIGEKFTASGKYAAVWFVEKFLEEGFETVMIERVKR